MQKPPIELSPEEIEELKPPVIRTYVINEEEFESIFDKKPQESKPFLFDGRSDNKKLKIHYIVLPTFSAQECQGIEEYINYFDIKLADVEYAINLAADSGLGMQAENADEIETLLQGQENLKEQKEVLLNLVFAGNRKKPVLLQYIKLLNNQYRKQGNP